MVAWAWEIVNPLTKELGSTIGSGSGKSPILFMPQPSKAGTDDLPSASMTVNCLNLPGFLRSRTWVVLGLVGGLIGGAMPARATQAVELTWLPSTSPDIVAYRVYYGTESGNYPNSITCGDVTDVLVPSLSDGVTYYFAVTAIDAQNNESAYSPDIVYTAPAPASIEVETDASTNALGAVAVAWTASSDGDVYGYQIEYGTQSGDYTNSVAFYGATNAILSGLAGGTTYYFAVAPIDSLGVEAVASDEAAYSVPTPVSLQLQAAVPAEAPGVELSWNPVANEGITGYYVYYGTQSGVYPNLVNAGDVTNFILGGLEPGQTYYCAVAPVDAYGNQGELSNVASSPAAGPAPVQIQAQPSSAALDAVEVSWTDSADTNVLGYVVLYWTPGTDTTNSMSFFDTTNAIISGLTPGLSYDFAIEPIDSFGTESIASSVVSSLVSVPEPIILAAQALGASTVELTWNSLTNEGAEAYTIYYGTQSGNYTASITVSTVTNELVSYLYGAETYYFAVAPLDAWGNQGPLSNEASATTLAPAPAALVVQTFGDTGEPGLIEIDTPSTVSGPWELDSSVDRQNWTAYTSGYGPGNGDGYDVDVYVSVDPTVPQMFFRLRQ